MDSRAQNQNQCESKNPFHFLEFELLPKIQSHRNIGIVMLFQDFWSRQIGTWKQTVIDSLAMTR